MARPIPEVVIVRLPMYARALALLEKQNMEFVSSHELASKLQMTPAQIRKDLSYFGRFGRQGRGYNVSRLLQELRQILGLDREWPMVLVGVGRLGRAIIDYRAFAEEGFRVMAAFDNDSKKVGKRFGGLVVQDASEMAHFVKEQGIDIAIVAVPPAEAQPIIDELVGCGIGAILNYAPVTAHVSANVRVREIDPVVALQSMTFYLKSKETSAKA